MDVKILMLLCFVGTAYVMLMTIALAMWLIFESKLAAVYPMGMAVGLLLAAVLTLCIRKWE